MSAGWVDKSDVTQMVEEMSDRCLAAYGANPYLVEEHFAIEREIAEGGYGRRQIFELVQNGADALLESGLEGGRIAVVLSDEYLYCANEGKPIDTDGVLAILGAHRSAKRGNQIGRFGVGFKSVLAVTDAPQFFSRSGSFRFDPDRSGDLIRSITDAERVASLRLAFPLSAGDEAEQDKTLADLMTWAATVVRLPLNRPGNEYLGADVTSFPARFMLFSGHVGELTLEDVTHGSSRRITTEAENETVILTENDRRERWKVVSAEYQVSENARATAGELADRESLPLTWAVPLDTATKRGAFWAFFPTQYWTTVRGIINAPWKTNADRQNLLQSEFNSELITQASQLIVNHLGGLSAETDPARHFDYLPGRGREAPQWADVEITEKVYDTCQYADIVPDLDGILRYRERVRLHPAGLPDEATAIFAEHSNDRAWAHPSVDMRERRSRVERIMDGTRNTIDAATWFQAIVSDPDDDVDLARLSAAAIRIAAELGEEHSNAWLKAPVVLTTGGRLKPLDPHSVFVGDTTATTEMALVHADVLAHDGVLDAVASLGIRELDATGRLAALLAGGRLDTDEGRARFWALARAVDPSVVAALIDSYPKLRVMARTEARQWAPLDVCLIPGEIVSSGDEQNAGSIIDLDYHAEDRQLLRRLGAVRGPVENHDPRSEPWFTDYKREMVRLFLASPEVRGRKPQEHLIVVTATGMVGPLAPIRRLKDRALERFCEVLLGISAATTTWTVSHKTIDDYGRTPCKNPAMWLVERDGLLPTTLGYRPAPDVVGPGLRDLGQVLPVAKVPPMVGLQFGLIDDASAVPAEHWQAALSARLGDTRRLGELLQTMAEVGAQPPVILTAPTGDIALSEIVACPPHADAEAIRDAGHVVAVFATPDAAEAATSLGLRTSAGLLQETLLVTEASEAVAAATVFPTLVAMGLIPDTLQIIPCQALDIERSTDLGSTTRAVSHRLDGDTLHIVGGASEREVLLDAIGKSFDLYFTSGEREDILADVERAKEREHKARIASAETPEERILEAVGRERLMRKLPTQIVQETSRKKGRELSDVEVVELAQAVHGVDIIKEHKDDLQSAGLTVPTQFAGGRAARNFVTSLGFSEEFAGFQTASYDSLVHVAGPPVMPELHDFQRTAANNVRELLRRGRGRGLLSLPTGAGKTRTAVQALIEGLVANEVAGPILWVAQTEELCEQAVQSWSDNWRAHGSRDTLKISRLWASNDAADLKDPRQIVVATIAKLDVVREDASYHWLSNANTLVIDEAHRATTPSYTALFDWMGMGRNRDRVPVVGLSATPFRGMSEDDTVKLVTRFGGNRLDDMAEDPYSRLQQMGVLARVEYRLLAGATVELTDDELAELTNLRHLAPSVMKRIGEDGGRNQMLVASIGSLDNGITVLLFCASVEHAELMAGLLSLEGIEARAISARTSRGARRHYVDQFRTGEIRVLTNYGVLTEGFDAPAVGAVFVARPTYSPNLYQQMIGRGLRGPANGGKESCLIANVEDNLTRYGVDLAFREFEHLWSEA